MEDAEKSQKDEKYSQQLLAEHYKNNDVLPRLHDNNLLMEINESGLIFTKPSNGELHTALAFDQIAAVVPNPNSKNKFGIILTKPDPLFMLLQMQKDFSIVQKQIQRGLNLARGNLSTLVNGTLNRSQSSTAVPGPNGLTMRQRDSMATARRARRKSISTSLIRSVINDYNARNLETQLAFAGRVEINMMQGVAKSINEAVRDAGRSLLKNFTMSEGCYSVRFTKNDDVFLFEGAGHKFACRLEEVYILYIDSDETGMYLGRTNKPQGKLEILAYKSNEKLNDIYNIIRESVTINKET